MGKINLTVNYPHRPGTRLTAAASVPQARGRVMAGSDNMLQPKPHSSPAQASAPVADSNFMNRVKQGQDRCHLKPVCVPVVSPINQPELMLYPKCHEVMRCVGSCCDEYNKCHPQRKRDVQRQVVHLRYRDTNGYTKDKTVNITLEEHLSCSCNDCGKEAPSCDKGYILGDWCECVCENVDIFGECIIDDEVSEENQKEDLHELVKHGKDACSLDLVCVPVPTNNTQQNVVIFPNCFEVHRCLGSCCNLHDNCHPIASRIIQKPAAELVYLGDDNFVLNKTVMVPIEEHIACSCINCDDTPQCKEGLKLDEDCQCS